MKAEFTVFRDFDGYWLVDKEFALKVEANPELYRLGALKFPTKIAACRLALSKAVEIGADELHIYGVGGTTSVSKEARKVGIKPFVYHPSIMTDLTYQYDAKYRRPK
jgi:hypothetical protein